jgi:TRAP-type C4-dicarboxylate transport system permease small subunit
MSLYSRLCEAIAKVLVAANLFGLLLMVVCLGLQVFTRYLMDNPFQATDEIAQNTLTWMCFLGAAFVYRERGHIEVDFLVARFPALLARAIAIATEIAIIALMVLIIKQGLSVAPIMSKVSYGTLFVSKFHMQYVPALISAVCTILFAIEHTANLWRGVAEKQASFQI